MALTASIAVRIPDARVRALRVANGGWVVIPHRRIEELIALGERRTLHEVVRSS